MKLAKKLLEATKFDKVIQAMKKEQELADKDPEKKERDRQERLKKGKAELERLGKEKRPKMAAKVTQSFNKPSKTKPIEDQISTSVLASLSKKQVSKGVFNYSGGSSGRGANFTIDTNKKVVSIDSVHSEDYHFLVQAAEKHGYKVKRGK